MGRDFGAELLAQVDLSAITLLLRQLPTGPLLAELEAIIAAMDDGDAARSRRRAGWWGRLLGRDLVAQAQPDPPGNRVRLRMTAAQAIVEDLAAQVAALEPVAARLCAQADQLEQRVGAQRAKLSTGIAVPEAAMERRLSHLDAIAASWRATVAHIALVRANATLLLDRHAQLRDLLLPLWRERDTARVAAAQVPVDRLAQLQQGLHELHASASSLNEPATDPRPPQELSP